MRGSYLEIYRIGLAKMVAIGLANFGRCFYVFFVSSGYDPDPLAGGCPKYFKNAGTQGLCDRIDPDGSIIGCLLEVSGFQHGYGNIGRCVECLVADLSGYHRSIIYL